MEQVQLIDVKLIQPDPFNPRKHFPKETLQQLAESIKTIGLQQPLKVKPKGKGYQLIFGHRRLKALELAGIEQVQAYVEDVDDLAVAERQLEENLQREDLAPLEIAAGYKRQRLLGRSVDEICARFGKKKSSVYGYIGLLEHVPAVRSALEKGEMLASVGLLFATVPKVRQADAVRLLTSNFRWDGPMSYDQAVDELQTFRLQATEAPFDAENPILDSGAGACVEDKKPICPKTVVEEGKVYCCDAPCWAKKVELQAKLVVENAKQEGATVLAGDAAEKALRGHEFVDLAEKSSNDSKRRPYGELLKKADVEKVVAVDEDGVAHELVRKTDAARELKEKKLAAANDYTISGGRSSPVKKTKAQKEAAAAELLEHKVNQRAKELALLAIAEVPATAKGGDVFARALLTPRLEGLAYRKSGEQLAKLLGLDLGEDGAGEAIEKLAKRKTGAELRGLLLQCTFVNALENNWDIDDEYGELPPACKALGVDVKALVKQAKYQLERGLPASLAIATAEKKPAAKKAKKPSKSKGGKKAKR